MVIKKLIDIGLNKISNSPKEAKSPEMSQKIGSAINETTNDITEALNPINDIIKKYPFIKLSKTGELYVDETHISFSSENLVNMISYTINSGVGFTGIDYKNIEKLIYSKNGNKNIIRICTGSKKNNKILLEKIYNGIFEEKNGDLYFTFSDFTDNDLKHLKMLFGVDRFKDTFLNVNFDDFFSYVWKDKGVRFGLDYDLLKSSNFSGLKREDLNGKTIKVASSKKVINSTSDEVELGENIKILKIPKKNNSGKVDEKKYEVFFPHAKKTEIILSIRMGRKGKNGIDIYGKTIEYKDNFKLDLSNFISEGKDFIGIKQEISQNGDKIYKIVAKEDVFINLVRNNEGGNKLKEYERGKIIGVIAGKEIVNKSSIGTETGDIEVKNNLPVFHQKADLEGGYTLEGENILLSGSNIFGKVISKQDLNIDGESNICNGFLQSVNGNITISKDTKIHTNTNIFAMNGKVIVEGDIEISTIIADEIIINGNAKGVNCIAKKVTVNGSVETSKIKGENININTDLGSNEIVAIIFYAIEKFKRHLELSQNKKRLFTEKSISIDNTIIAKQLELEQLKERAKESKDYKNSELMPGNLRKIELEIQALEGQKKIILNKISEDNDNISRIEKFLEQFSKDTVDDILKINISNEKSDIIIYPTGFIFDDNQHNLLNPNDTKNRKKDKLLFLESIMKESFNNNKHLKTQKNLDYFSISYEELYKNLIEYLRHLNINSDANLVGSGLNTKKSTILKIKAHDFFEHFSNRKITEMDIKRFNIVRVSIDGFSNCYLGDISIKGGTFLVNKNINLYEKESICDVKFELETNNGIIEIKSYFWINDISEAENHKKITGFFLESSVESILFKYFSYLEIKNRDKRIG